ncbi:hypothetical protein SELMODRAFT_442677 [Selaginella moellendorffii]|uniref:Amino acid transporter transmembrane domain-containing protein n=1 Tax=Selaginella moellendorffii TaxID=88036 RepID=D8RV82_SELML|nr:amino acid permease 1 [Selaginella moellendorffii]EFJ23727.1 hypothetical protein SELMODRAFT_442677 [Selaginella moellendorffii]|eukprot:XP_002974942.1 amino acid permease 1 [Selaginella moellendorffii]
MTAGLDSSLPNGAEASIDMRFHGGAGGSEKQVERTGNVCTASAHVITAVIGSGVLSLAWSIAQFGWVPGPAILFIFSIVTFYASLLLADCYRSPDPAFGRRNTTYIDAVKNILGGRQEWFCGLAQYGNLIGATIGYTITSGKSMVAISKGHCLRHNRHLSNPSSCNIHDGRYLLVFGAAQLLFSQIPDIHQIWWLSIVASIMSFSYSFVGLGLSAGQAVHGTQGTAFGIGIGPGPHSVSSADKVWGILQALGNIAFAYSFSSILIEIQDTLKSPPSENVSMKRATSIGVLVTTIFYMAVGCVGYAAFGNDAPGNLLTGFAHSKLFWLVDFANICIIIHLVGGYQVYAQPVFALGEWYASQKWPKSNLVNREYSVTVLTPRIGVFRFTIFKLFWRTLFVLFTTIVSLVFPFFNAVIGLVGAITFWPLTVYFPVEMYSKQSGVRRWSCKAMALQSLSFVCFLVSLSAAVGSVQGIISSSRRYKPFEF